VPVTTIEALNNEIERMDRLENLARRCLAILVAASVPGGAGSPTWPQSANRPEQAIRAALAKWTSDFNARDASHICDLFASDLLYDYRGFPERDHAALCGLLHRSLADCPPCLDTQGGFRWEDGRIARTRPRRIPPATRRKLEDRPLHRL
jgi:hypothetical protein